MISVKLTRPQLEALISVANEGLADLESRLATDPNPGNDPDLVVARNEYACAERAIEALKAARDRKRGRPPDLSREDRDALKAAARVLKRVEDLE